MDNEYDAKRLYEIQEYETESTDHGFENVNNTKLHIASTPVLTKKEKTITASLIIINIILSLIIILMAGVIIYYSSSSPSFSCNCITSGTNTAGNTGALTAPDPTDNITKALDPILTSIGKGLNDSSLSTNLKLDSLMQMLRYMSSNITSNRYSSQDNMDLLLELSNDTDKTLYKLSNIVNTLSSLKDMTTTTAGVTDDILLLVGDLLALQNTTLMLPTSCSEIKTRQPNSPSGTYVLGIGNGTLKEVYCNMDVLCGSGGGWTRLAYLDMTDATMNCPTGFRLYQANGVRACGRPVGGGGCASVTYPSYNISYSQICGRAIGYQFSSPDGVQNLGPEHNNINGPYVDGVSITRGSPRVHVWTLIGSLMDRDYPAWLGGNDGRYNCPCSTGSSQTIQSFVGSNYFCESGNQQTNGGFSPVLYTGDPLWDKQGCGSIETQCCAAPGLPWFHRDWGNTTTTDYLELRVCGEQSTADEDVPVSFYEIYVK